MNEMWIIAFEFMRSTDQRLIILEALMDKILSITNDLKAMTNTNDDALVEQNSIQRERQTKHRLETFGSIGSKNRYSYRRLWHPLLRMPSTSSSKCLNLHDNSKIHDKNNVSATSFKPLDTENFPFVSHEDSCIINVISENSDPKMYGSSAANSNSATLDRSSRAKRAHPSTNAKNSPHIIYIDEMKEISNQLNHTNHRESIEDSNFKLVDKVREEFDKSYNRMMETLNQEDTIDYDNHESEL
ncbi:hypothetical protein HUG17_8487 [Dermatophagoides farinae]|uniref:Uncharacterized protein n=1 Tax=Dermatophagoides farinae TaxID=6954 RepID=A0A9D4SGP8_DERFA|nr:hypothetical protein HUG17_8487 [Dermatophagoides farinae]